MDEEEAEPAPQPEKDPTLALFLGLYLILLAFFVLLNTMATLKDDRVKSVMGSLLATFSTEILNVANPTEFTASVGEDLATEEFHRDVEDFFEVAVPLAKVEFFSAGTIMRIALPADQLFEPDSTRVRSDRQDLMHRITGSLSRRVIGLRYEIEFSTFTGPFFFDDLASGQVLEVARAGAFARELLRRKVPPDSIVIGSRPGNPEEVEITFFIRIEQSSKVDFEGEGG